MHTQTMDKYKQKNNEVTNFVTYNASLKLIRVASLNKWTKQLAFWHILKHNYSNGVIYHYKSRMPEIAEKYEISTKSLYNYLAILRKKKLVFDTHKNLHLKSIRTIKKSFSEKKKYTIHISDTDSLWIIQCKLYSKLIEKHVQNILFNEALKKAISGRNGRKTVFSENAPYCSLSVRNAAKVLNTNHIKAMRIFKTLNELQIIKSTPQRAKLVLDKAGRPIITKMLLPEFVEDYPGYKFVFNEKLYLQFGSNIELLQFPAKFPQISTKKAIQIINKRQSGTCKNINNL